MLFPSPAGAELAPEALRERLAEALARHAQAHPGTSERIERAVVLTEPPSLDAGETTDKGYINQRQVLARRQADVARLFAEPPGADVIRRPAR